MGVRPDISAFWGKPLLYTLIGFSLWVLSVLVLKTGLVPAMVLAIIPLAVYLLIRLLERPILAFFVVIGINYFIMGSIRYIPGLSAGIIMDGLLLLTFIFSLFRGRERAIDWTGVRNLLTLLSGIWLIYCILLVFNPVTTLAHWAAGVRGLAVYLFIFPLLTAVLLNRYKYLKTFLFIWSVLTLLAVFKALIQKYIGFDPAEKYWLYVTGGSSTHIISSGIRYFSFFTDAASFGCGMGMSMVVFSITALYIRSKSLRFYFIAVALLAGYGMMISGTRAAIAVPFVGYAFFVLLSKQWKIIIPGIVVIACAFVFFKYTYIGHGNTEIRRMRSAFNVTQDASFQVRQANQAKMRVFMKDQPFGIGIGKAKRVEPGDYMYQLPTDTSLVYVWVETGMVGLTLFLLIFLITFVKGIYEVWFQIHNKQLRGILCALLAGLAGMLACAYGNEMLQQFPNGPIVYICMAFIFMGRKLDKAISDEEIS
ncbi:O-antigen ligase family protein [Proteiniphilum sp.]|uniref:O-antigen ligase family protein n=1 Tax=Proteiniphilum sp. TaxID=1926877 RepID=UPI002B1EAF3F|nr:O-antigen ligase family protein [Proteiniphilum sp.]MEA4915962.1 O-antigen ligase family protein [Proteiniphilum sp.]